MKRPFVILPAALLTALLVGAGPPKEAPRALRLTPADSLRVIIEPLFIAAKYDTILEILPAYIRRAEAAHDSVLLGRALAQRGRVMIMIGRHDQGERDIDLGIHIAESVRDTTGLMPALHFKGFVYVAVGRYADAKRCFERRLLLAQRTRSPADEAWAHTGIAYVLMHDEQYQESRAEYLRAIALFRANGLTRLEITSLVGLGRVESALGDTRAAVQCYQRAWVASRKAGDRLNEMWAMNNLGHQELERGDLNRAVQYQRRAFELARELKSPQAIVVPAINLATHAEALEDFESAEATLNEARELCVTQGVTEWLATVDLYIADLRMRQGRNHAAAAMLRRLAWNLDAVDPQHRDLVPMTLAQVLAASDSVPAAIQVLVDYLKRGHPAYREAEARMSLAVARFDADINDTQAALEYAIRARTSAERAGQRRFAVAAAFIESSCRCVLGQKEAAVATFYAALDSMEAFRGGITTADWREVYGQEIARSVVDAGEVLREEPASASQAARDEAFFDAMQRVKTRTLLDRITEPRAGATTSMDPRHYPVCTLRELQTALAPGEVVLDFYVGTRRSFLAVVTPDSSRVTELPGPGSPLEKQIRLYNTVVGSSDPAVRAQYGPERLAVVQRALGREILPGHAVVLDRLSRVFVCADGFFATIPFGVLIARDGGDILLVNHDVVQIPSASVLVRERSIDPHRHVADPVVVAIGARTSGLRGARDEVRNLARHYARVRVIDGIADVDAFQRVASQCDVLHIASHALAVDRSPWLSGVRLSGTPAGAPHVAADTTHNAPAEKSPALVTAADSLFIARAFRPDPYLRAWQIAPLQLPTKLAVLSACETAGGRATTGEGTLGLTAAFLSSGVPVVVASLWPVSDRATAAIMRGFYRHLADGQPVATALRLAQLEVSHSSGSAHPFYWAGFTVVGDGSMSVAIRRRPAWPLALAVAVGTPLLVVLALVSRTRRQRAQVG